MSILNVAPLLSWILIVAASSYEEDDFMEVVLEGRRLNQGLHPPLASQTRWLCGVQLMELLDLLLRRCFGLH